MGISISKSFVLGVNGCYNTGKTTLDSVLLIHGSPFCLSVGPRSLVLQIVIE